MKKNKYIPVLFLLMAIVAVSAIPGRQKRDKVYAVDGNTSLAKVLVMLGDKKPLHHMEMPGDEMVRKGREIVFTGITDGPNGKKTKKVSQYFNCTHCHNTAIEDPDLTKSDPVARLEFVSAKGMSFLPGTTFYGVVNRTSWYNGDYAVKYGALVTPARDTLANAIQLCAMECSQGRRMEKWEINAVIAYFYSIGYKLQDLKLSEEEFELVNRALYADSQDYFSDAIKMLKSKYFNASPATFSYPLPKETRNYGKDGNVNNGERIYEKGCMTCHKTIGGVTNFKFDKEKITFRHLRRHLEKNNKNSVYYMVRKGTYAVPGYRPYMPNYPLERLSEQQLEDLVAYIQQQAK